VTANLFIVSNHLRYPLNWLSVMRYEFSCEADNRNTLYRFCTGSWLLLVIFAEPRAQWRWRLNAMGKTPTDANLVYLITRGT